MATKEQKNEFMRYFGTEALKVLESWMKKVGEEIDQGKIPFSKDYLFLVDMRATLSAAVSADESTHKMPFLNLGGKFFAPADPQAKIKEQQG